MQTTQLKTTSLGQTGLVTSAVAWALRHPTVDGAIFGVRSPQQVDPLIGAAHLELSDDDITTIEGEQSPC